MNEQLVLDLQLDARADFERYVTGSNELIVHSLRRLAGGRGPSPIYLWSHDALGKSHLLQATCHLAGTPTRRVIYLPLKLLQCYGAELFADLDSLDLICIDDIDTIVGNADWEHALFAALERARATGQGMVLAAGVAAVKLGWDLPDLASRVGASLALKLAPLNDAERREVLNRKVQEAGLEIDTAALRYLELHSRRDLRSLLAVLKRVDIASLRAQRRVSVPMLRKLLLEQD